MAKWNEERKELESALTVEKKNKLEVEQQLSKLQVLFCFAGLDWIWIWIALPFQIQSNLKTDRADAVFFGAAAERCYYPHKG